MGPKRSTRQSAAWLPSTASSQNCWAQKAALAPWLELDLPLETQSTHQIMIQLGTLPANRPFEEGEQAVQGAGELVQLTQISADRELRYCLLVCHTSQEEGALEALKALGWVPCQSAGLDGDGGRKHGPAGPELESWPKSWPNWRRNWPPWDTSGPSFNSWLTWPRWRVTERNPGEGC